MQVDEASFRSNISAVQLLSIESKEMASILEELVSAIGLQRFRFVDRQTNGRLYVDYANEGVFVYDLLLWFSHYFYSSSSGQQQQQQRKATMTFAEV
jgi:hypothetical protein